MECFITTRRHCCINGICHMTADVRTSRAAAMRSICSPTTTKPPIPSTHSSQRQRLQWIININTAREPPGQGLIPVIVESLGVRCCRCISMTHGGNRKMLGLQDSDGSVNRFALPIPLRHQPPPNTIRVRATVKEHIIIRSVVGITSQSTG